MLGALVTILTACLGLIIAVAKGIDRIGKFEQSWVSYRKASESMKREYRLYINNAGPYSTRKDEEQAYRLFVEQVEQRLLPKSSRYFGKAGKLQTKGVCSIQGQH